MATLVIDIGNTRLSWRFRNSAGDQRSGSSSHSAISDVFADLPRSDRIAISSVQSDHESEVREWLDGTGQSDAIWIRSGADLASCVLTEQPEKTGADRALCALAWGVRNTGCSAVIIDAGTAVTVDAVSATGELLGGWIAPGFDSLRNALNHAAPALPDPEAVSHEGSWAVETRSAIQGGLHTLFVGGVNSLRERVLRGLDENAVTVVTGGDAMLLVDQWDEVIHQPGMVLDGLEAMLLSDREYE